MQRSLTTGTLIVVGAGLVIKVIGFASRLIISNTIGAEGMGLYQLFYPFYSLVILTIASGITIAQSGMISSAVARREWQVVRKINLGAFLISTCISVLVGLILFFSAEFISNQLYHDERLALSIKVFAPFIPFITAGAVIRGYFYGLGRTGPSAIGGILEQIGKISVILLFAAWGLQYGLAHACMILAIGLVAGEILNFLVVLLFFIKRDKNEKGLLRLDGLAEIIKEIIHTCAPVSLNRFIMSILGAVEVILIKNALISSGLEYTFSIEEFGRLMGMVMPLLFFPMVLTNAISTTVVPAIAEAMAVEDMQKCGKRVSKAILFSISSGFVFTAVFLAYPGEISWMAYKSVLCKDLIYLTGFSCIFIYLQQTLIGILNGLGKQRTLFGNTMLGFVLRLGGIFLLMPVMAIKGYVYAYILSSFVVCFFNFAFILKYIKLPVEFGRWVLRPTMVCIFMIYCSEIILKFTSNLKFNDRINVFFAVILLTCFGYFLMFASGVLNLAELKAMLHKRQRSEKVKTKSFF